MAEIKFSCPKCKQRVLVDDSGVGMEIGCPRCKAALIIPATHLAIAQLAKPGLEIDGVLSEQFATKQKEMEGALLEAKRMVAEGEKREQGLSVQLAAMKTDAEKREQALTAQVEAVKAEAAAREREFNSQLAAAKAAADQESERVKSLEEKIAAAETKREEAGTELAQLRAMTAEAETLRVDLAALQVKVAEGEKLRGLLEEAKLKLNEASNLRGQLDAAREQAKDVERWKKDVEVANVQLVKLRNDHAALAVDRDGIKALLTDSEKQLTDQNVEMARLRGELIEVSEKLAAAERVHSTLSNGFREEATALREQLSAANASLIAARDERDALVKANARPQADSGELAAVKKELGNARELLNGSAQQVAALRIEIEKANLDRDDTRSQLAKNEAAYREVSSRVESARLSAKSALNAMATAKTAGAKAEAEARDATARANSLQQRVAELENELATLNGELAGVRTSMHIAHAERDEATRSFAPSEKEGRELKNKLMQAATNEHTLRLQLDAAEKNAASACERLKAVEAEREKLLGRFGDLGKSLDESNEQLMVAQNAREIAASKVAQIGAELATATDSLRSLGVERDAARIELESTRAGLERTKKHVAVLQDRVSQLRGENERMRVQLGLAPEAAG